MEKKLKVQNSAGKVTARESGDNGEILLVEFLKRRTKFNSERYVQALKKLNKEVEGFGLTGG